MAFPRVNCGDRSSLSPVVVEAVVTIIHVAPHIESRGMSYESRAKRLIVFQTCRLLATSSLITSVLISYLPSWAIVCRQ